jgi:serine/threonine-protein kinase
MVDSEGTQEVTVKRACISCGREFAGNLTVCPEDNTPLTVLAHDRDIGSVIGDRYEILGIVGKGGMGRVYKARHRLMKRIVAIKMLYPNLVSTSSTLKRFQQEAQATSTLSHPNILTVYDFGLTDDGQPYLVMDFLEGISLADVLQEEGNLEVDRCLRIFYQAAAGLAHAHSKGVVHRDLKPSNLMLVNLDENPDFVKIVDFGIAKMMSLDPTEAEPLTRTGEVFGSPMYMSPEQCRGQQLDLRTDIYSLGCVIYRALTGLSPFIGHDQLECMFKQVNERPGSFTEVCPDLFISEELEAVVFKMLEKAPDSRYQTMSEVRQALEAFLPDFKTMTTVSPVRQTTEQPVVSVDKVAITGSTGKLETTSVDNSQAAAASNDKAAVSPPVSLSTTEIPGPTLDPPPAGGFLNKRWLIRAGIGAVLGIAGAWFMINQSQKSASTLESTGKDQAKNVATVTAPATAGAKTQEEMQFDVNLKAAQALFDKGNYNQSESYAVEAMKMTKTFPHSEKQVVACANLLGAINYAQGQYDDAAAYLKSCLRYAQLAYGDKSVEVAAVKTMLGRSWAATKDYSQARIVLEQALSTRQGLLGNSDLTVADTLSALADVDLRQGKADDAITRLTRALEIREVTQGKESLDVANACNDLAQAYQLKRSFGKALDLYKQALEIRQKKLPADSPTIADSYLCIGSLCEETGQVEQAKTLYQSALRIQEGSLAPGSPRLADTKRRLEELTSGKKHNTGSLQRSFRSMLAK